MVNTTHYSRSTSPTTEGQHRSYDSRSTPPTTEGPHQTWLKVHTMYWRTTQDMVNTTVHTLYWRTTLDMVNCSTPQSTPCSEGQHWTWSTPQSTPCTEGQHRTWSTPQTTKGQCQTWLRSTPHTSESQHHTKVKANTTYCSRSIPHTVQGQHIKEGIHFFLNVCMAVRNFKTKSRMFMAQKLSQAKNTKTTAQHYSSHKHSHKTRFTLTVYNIL